MSVKPLPSIDQFADKLSMVLADAPAQSIRNKLEALITHRMLSGQPRANGCVALFALSRDASTRLLIVWRPSEHNTGLQQL
jgi:hypothetical protein